MKTFGRPKQEIKKEHQKQAEKGCCARPATCGAWMGRCKVRSDWQIANNMPEKHYPDSLMAALNDVLRSLDDQFEAAREARRVDVLVAWEQAAAHTPPEAPEPENAHVPVPVVPSRDETRPERIARIREDLHKARRRTGRSGGNFGRERTR